MDLIRGARRQPICGFPRNFEPYCTRRGRTYMSSIFALPRVCPRYLEYDRPGTQFPSSVSSRPEECRCVHWISKAPDFAARVPIRHTRINSISRRGSSPPYLDHAFGHAGQLLGSLRLRSSHQVQGPISVVKFRIQKKAAKQQALCMQVSQSILQLGLGNMHTGLVDCQMPCTLR